MRMKDVNARKAYIQNVRKSFDSPGRSYEFEKENENKKGEASEEPSFFKVRLIIAVIIFAAYVFCDKTNMNFYQLTTKEVSEKIAQNFDYETAKDEVLQVFHEIQEK